MTCNNRLLQEGKEESPLCRQGKICCLNYSKEIQGRDQEKTSSSIGMKTGLSGESLKVFKNRLDHTDVRSDFGESDFV